MRKNFFLSILTVLCLILSACGGSGSDSDAVVSLSGNSFQLPADGSVIVKLNIKNYRGGDVQIPVLFSGTAVKDVDYIVSSETFNLSKGIGSAEIIFTAKDNYGDDKTVNISLGAIPAGVVTEGNTSAVISIVPKENIYYAFGKGSYLMTQTADPTISLRMGNGNYRATEDIVIPIEIDVDGTTAEEGVHYEFDGAKQIVIARGEYSGSVKINWLKNEVGKDVVKLKIGTIDRPGLFAGLNDKTSVKLFGPIAGQIKGSWAGLSFTNYDWFVLNCDWMDPKELYPTISASDKLHIGDEGFKTELSGPLKNYFRDGVIEFLKEELLRYQEEAGYPQKTVQTVKISNVNVKFSATQQQVRSAVVSFRVYKDGNDRILEVTMGDYEPTEFLVNTYDGAKDWGDVPVMASYPLRFTFKEIKE